MEEGKSLTRQPHPKVLHCASPEGKFNKWMKLFFFFLPPNKKTCRFIREIIQEGLTRLFYVSDIP